jgi:hypothetical protein
VAKNRSRLANINRRVDPRRLRRAADRERFPRTPLSFRSRRCPVSVDGVAFPPSSIRLERPPALMAGRKAFASQPSRWCINA